MLVAYGVVLYICYCQCVFTAWIGASVEEATNFSGGENAGWWHNDMNYTISS